MALDGIYLNCLKNEIEQKCIGCKVDKVRQPSKEEIILVMRGRGGSSRLTLCARANSPGVHLTEHSPENPQNPPMLCMLLRKKLCGAVLSSVRQIGLDRIIFFDFDASNEIGDPVKLSLCVEIMAKYSNIILIDGEGIIIDSVKRVDSSKSSVREILPSLKYTLPPSQNKMNLLESPQDKIINEILRHKGKMLSSAILCVVEGVSPIVCRELAYLAGGDAYIQDMTNENIRLFKDALTAFCGKIKDGNTLPTVIFDADGSPKDFSFTDISQYGDFCNKKTYESCSELLDEFYFERDKTERLKQRAQDLFKLLNSLIERISRKINVQTAELLQCDNKENLRIFAELINANQYRLSKGTQYYEAENYYEDNKLVRIPCDPALTPVQNAHKYYKEYKKAFTKEKMLKEQLEYAKAELEYLTSVLACLKRAETEEEIYEIRAELEKGGYLKRKQKKGAIKHTKPSEPMKFLAEDGTVILVGKNNTQNDFLTLKQAAKNDVWFHAKNVAGSHVILCADLEKAADRTVEQAAQLAAYYSDARASSKVAVDYTYVKNVKKPNGAKPGMVIYETNYTVFVDPKDYPREK